MVFDPKPHAQGCRPNQKIKYQAKAVYFSSKIAVQPYLTTQIASHRYQLALNDALSPCYALLLWRQSQPPMRDYHDFAFVILNPKGKPML